VAARDTTQRKPATTQRTVTLKRLDGIRGAAWIITARGWKQRGKRHLVAAHKQNEQSAHERTLREVAGVGDAGSNGDHVRSQSVDRGGVRLASRANGEIDGGLFAKRRKKFDTHELSQAPFQSIAIDGRALMARDNDTNAWKLERGSDDPDIEMYGPNTLPLSNDGLYVGAPRQSISTREGKSAVMRLRTCSGA
jgi:hypothetical protein